MHAVLALRQESQTPIASKMGVDEARRWSTPSAWEHRTNPDWMDGPPTETGGHASIYDQSRHEPTREMLNGVADNSSDDVSENGEST